MRKADSLPFAARPANAGPAAPPPGRRRGRSVRTLAGAAMLFALLGAGGLKGASYTSLDLLARKPDPRPNPIENPRETFTGSAFFFAEKAFEPDPAASTAGDTRHIWALRRVDAALSLPYAGITPLDRYRALNCLTSAIYYEAANEPNEGQRAVAQVVLNRVRHPAWPKSVCGVVYQGAERTDLLCQFTFSCDGAMARPPVADKWARARRVAEIALSGRVFAPVGVATFYHTLAVRPEWSSRLDPVAVVGAHIFYQMRGANGRPTAFRMPYSGRELIAGPPPRVWKPISPGALPVAMPYMPEVEQAIGPAPSPGLPVMPGQMPHVHAGAAAQPGPGWTEPAQPTPDLPGQTLPQSTIRPEYRDSGRPLI